MYIYRGAILLLFEKQRNNLINSSKLFNSNSKKIKIGNVKVGVPIISVFNISLLDHGIVGDSSPISRAC